MKNIVLVCTLILISAGVDAATLRYALVVGNNRGLDQDGRQPFANLKHAEREARVLKDQLVSLANFNPDRTIMLLGTTRLEIKKAVEHMARQKENDLKELNNADTLFAFFFTGHGLQGQLLLEDGPITATELGQLFQAINADFNIGFFDACFSGSLDEAVLDQKGVRSTPGLNIFKELPEEVLTAEGSIWFVSSGPSQMSYEDRKLGGVFTHFFIEALEEGHAEGPGITLDSVWSYVRNKTVEYTTSRGRRQVPQQFVANLKSTGPFYFSFPLKREATLELSASVDGQFVLTYADGQFTEVINKKAGNALQMSVYPGEARIMLVNQGQVQAQKDFELHADRPVYLRGELDMTPTSRLGLDDELLWQKGFGSHSIKATAKVPAWSFLLGGNYVYNPGGQGLLSAAHQALASLRLERSVFHAGLSLGYGYKKEDFESFSYTSNGLVGALRLGMGWDLWKIRMALAAGMIVGANWQKFDDGAERTKLLYQPTGWFSLLFPVSNTVLAEISLSGGPAYLPGVGKDTGFSWQFQGGLGLGLYYKI
jgi:hypothetical protein